MRNTDDDWKDYGKFEPYYGVLTHDRFLRCNLTEETLEEFWDSGRHTINGVWSDIERLFGQRPCSSALDFGCGVGRLTHAMAEIATNATGVDISNDMIEEAKTRALPNMKFASEIPKEQFDWINSFIVFQHIPPVRGYELLNKLVDQAAEECTLTLHFTLFKDAQGLNAHGLPSMIYGTWDGTQIKSLVPRELGHTMMMYDYDLTRIFGVLVSNGFDKVHLIHENHAGAHGARIYAVR